jgi:hypothetical protein
MVKYSERSGKEIVVKLEERSVMVQDRVSREFHEKSKELTTANGDRLVCNWLKKNMDK